MGVARTGRVAAVTAILVLALALSGCDEDTARPASDRLTREELEWLRDHLEWQVAYEDALVEAYQTSSPIVDEFADCEESWRSVVGEPPGGAFDWFPVELGAACEELMRVLAVNADDLQAFDEAYRGLTRVGRRASSLTLEGRELPSAPAESASYADALLGRVATEQSGIDTVVRCWSAAEWDALLTEKEVLTRGRFNPEAVGGYADSGRGGVELQDGDCAVIARLVAGDVGDVARAAWATGVLAHEIEHLRSAGPEAETECRAVQNHARVAEALGVPRARARELARAYWDEIYPNNSDEYRTAECAPGGGLDVYPETSAEQWPWG